MRTRLKNGAMSLCAALATVVTLTAAAAEATITAEEKKIFEEKCSPCHSTARILSVAPDKVRQTIARMEEKNPPFFEEVSGDRLAEIASRMLQDPELAARREALELAVEKGKTLFGDSSLGRNGKSCLDCHTVDSLRGRAETFPKFNERLKRVVGLNEVVNLMISSNMNGRVLPLGDERAVALEAYLRSLR